MSIPRDSIKNGYGSVPYPCQITWESRTLAIMLLPKGGCARDINWDLPFAPERLTPLAYTPIYPNLTDRERIVYNQNCGLYINEQIAFFELELSDFMVAVANLDCTRSLRSEILRFILDEEQHAAGFLDFNRRAAPALFGQHNHVFVRLNRFEKALGKRVMRAPSLLPYVLWVILLMEERALSYATVYAEESSLLEPSFVHLHLTHAQEEEAHLSLDNRLVDLLWDQLPTFLKGLNVFLLRHTFREFLYFPKRAALEVVLTSFPGHPDLPLMVQQIHELRYSKTFLRSLYNRSSHPVTLSLMDRRPELAPFALSVEGYYQ